MGLSRTSGSRYYDSAIQMHSFDNGIALRIKKVGFPGPWVPVGLPGGTHVRGTRGSGQLGAASKVHEKEQPRASHNSGQWPCDRLCPETDAHPCPRPAPPDPHPPTLGQQEEVNAIIHCEDGAVVTFINRIYEALTQRKVQAITRRPLPDNTPKYAKHTGKARAPFCRGTSR